jgi:hypothetical protein
LGWTHLLTDGPNKNLVTNYLSLPIGDAAPDEVNAVIEIPRGTANKYEYDKQLNVFRLDRNLHSPVHYPGDYGFVPSTLSLTATRWTCWSWSMRPAFPDA